MIILHYINLEYNIIYKIDVFLIRYYNLIYYRYIMYHDELKKDLNTKYKNNINIKR